MFVDYTISTLRRLLSESYNIQTIDAPQLARTSWMAKTSLLIIPGGRATPYAQGLAGLANGNIIDYVKNGGSYLGFCAGSYFASDKVEFEIGNPIMEVNAKRPLGFFPGTCKGAAFSGFDYASEAGARAVKVTSVHTDMTYPIYWNGGGAFIDADKYDNIDVLARYQDIPGTSNNVAAVLARYGKGRALLSAVHAEYVPSQPNSKLYNEIHPMQSEIDKLVRIWLGLLKLDLRQTPQPVPHLSANRNGRRISTA
ncbi:biotin holocarboxylase synthetase [Entomophthora muscae]|uniref:Biotin holocarboxylase synthetase n=1 Tax=Entomophthora muscae TaxID=34485 RepID=A0ACC2SS31_9FUNG|nr:biotin holocarboxylase synthetase [Entomophthora muscae]